MELLFGNLQPDRTNMQRITNIIIVAVFVLFSGCLSPQRFIRDFYSTNEVTLLQIKNEFHQLYDEKPFSVLFTERTFSTILFSFITDTTKYVYEFNLNDPTWADSLLAHGYNAAAVQKLVHDMQQIHCTWIANQDYYELKRRKFITVMSVRNKALNSAFAGESYCTLAYFSQPQMTDEEGNLLYRIDRRRRLQLNGERLKKVNDSVGYAISKHFR